MKMVLLRCVSTSFTFSLASLLTIYNADVLVHLYGCYNSHLGGRKLQKIVSLAQKTDFFVSEIEVAHLEASKASLSCQIFP